MSLKYQHLVGVPFGGIGIRDCFTTVRLFYAENFGIHIRDYARPVDWESEKRDIIRQTFEREGFTQIVDWKAADLQPGDLMVMTLGASCPNHFAIYVGDSLLLQHIAHRQSSLDEYRDFWRNSTGYLLRHRDVPDLRPTYPDVELRSLLDAQHRLEAD